MYNITKVLENFFNDKVSFFLKGSPIPVYRTRQAVSKLGSCTPVLSPAKNKVRRTSACSSASSAGTSGSYSEESLGRKPSLAIGRCTRSLRSRSNMNQKHDVSEDGESDVDGDSLSADVSSCNESVASLRQTRSTRKTQLLSLSSSESTCVDEAGHSMRLRTRAGGHLSGRGQGRRKRRAPETDNSDEGEEESGEESGEESDSGEEYVGVCPQRGRGKRGRRGRGRGRGAKGRGRPEGRRLRKCRRVSSYSDEEEEEEGGALYGMAEHRTITSRSGRIVKPALKFSCHKFN